MPIAATSVLFLRSMPARTAIKIIHWKHLRRLHYFAVYTFAEHILSSFLLNTVEWLIWLQKLCTHNWRTKIISGLFKNATTRLYPIKNYRGLSPNNRGKRWAYVPFIRGAANHPIILHYEACKCSYLCIYSKWSIYE